MSAKKRARAVAAAAFEESGPIQGARTIYYRGTVQHAGTSTGRTGPAHIPVAYIERAALPDPPYNGVLGWDYAPPVPPRKPPKPRRLTTRQAWLRIAEAFEARASGGTHPNADTASLATFGLGVAISFLHAWGCITEAQARTMGATHGRTLDEQIRAEGETFGSCWRTDTELAGLRAMLATLFALEPEA